MERNRLVLLMSSVMEGEWEAGVMTEQHKETKKD